MNRDSSAHGQIIFVEKKSLIDKKLLCIQFVNISKSKLSLASCEK